jgi:hypothetical protein
MKNLRLMLMALAAFFMLQSCEKEPQPQGDAPKLPGVEMFVMPFDDVQEVDDEVGGDEVAPRSYDHFGYAVANVVVWNTAIKLHLSIPVLAFHESFNHQPVYQGGGTWLWAYSVSNDQGTFNAKLYGELLPATEEVKWDMYISKVNGFTDVHWYTGITAWDESYANWTLNQNPLNPTPFIEANFVRDNGKNTASMTYTNVIPNDPGNGSYIEYRKGEIPSTVLDRAYDVFRAEADNLLEIQWNSVDKHGRVKDEEKFGDTDWRCWGTDFKDTDC